jgi:predicted nucleic acid-binding protein
VLDANILIRAVLGSRVLSLLRKYADQMKFLAPDTAFQEAREHLPQILERRNMPLAPAFAVLELVAMLAQTIELRPTHGLSPSPTSASADETKTIGRF